MNPTRRTLFRSLFAGAVVAALPTGPVAAALPATTGKASHPRWNTPELVSVDDDPRPGLEPSWSAMGWLFIDSHGFPGPERHTQRKVHISVYTDGSMRIAFMPINTFERLHYGRGFTAINIAPDLATEVWGGVFATSDDDALPVQPFTRKPWSDAEYMQQQRRLGRRDIYAGTEQYAFGDDGASYNWFKGDDEDVIEAEAAWSPAASVNDGQTTGRAHCPPRFASRDA